MELLNKKFICLDSSTQDISLEKLTLQDLTSYEKTDRTIYVRIDGSDNGDGSSTNPFATIGAALRDIKDVILDGRIVIDIGEGTFSISKEDRSRYSEIIAVSTRADIIFKGKQEWHAMSGVTFTQRNDDPFIFDASGTRTIKDEKIGVADGSSFEFNVSTLRDDIVPESVTITASGMTVTADTSGNLIGDVSTARINTINYETGDITVTFINEPSVNDDILIDYDTHKIFYTDEFKFGYAAGYYWAWGGNFTQVIVNNGENWVEVSSPEGFTYGTSWPPGVYPQKNYFFKKPSTIIDLTAAKSPYNDTNFLDGRDPTSSSPKMRYFDLEFTNWKILEFHNSIQFERCHFSVPDKRVRLKETVSSINIGGTSFLGGIKISGNVKLNGCYLTHSSEFPLIVKQGSFANLTGIYIDGNSSTEGIQISKKGKVFADFGIKIKNPLYAINFEEGGGEFYYQKNLHFDNVDYVIRNNSSAGVKFEPTTSDTNNLVINYNNSFIYPEGNTELVNLVKGTNIEFEGLYPEYTQNQEIKLDNDTSTYIIVGNIIQNRSIKIDYTIERGTGYRSGSFNIVQDGSAYISTDNFVQNPYASVDSSAIAFSADVSGNYIRLAAWQNNVADSSLMYNLSRVMV